MSKYLASGSLCDSIVFRHREIAEGGRNWQPQLPQYVNKTPMVHILRDDDCLACHSPQDIPVCGDQWFSIASKSFAVAASGLAKKMSLFELDRLVQ